MKFWISSRTMFSHTNPHRALLSHTLHLRYRHRLLFSSPYLPRCKLRMTNPEYTCKRSIVLLYLYLRAHRSGTLLRIISLHRNLKHWCGTPSFSDDNRLRRLCPTLGPDVLLGCDCYYQPTLGISVCGQRASSMDLRRVFS